MTGPVIWDGHARKKTDITKQFPTDYLLFWKK